MHDQRRRADREDPRRPRGHGRSARRRFPDGRQRRIVRPLLRPDLGAPQRRTRPAPGNHDYGQPEPAPYSASAYFAYFGDRAGPPGRGYYSYDRGAWHIVSLNSNCMVVSCAAGSAQERWLRNDLCSPPRRLHARILAPPTLQQRPAPAARTNRAAVGGTVRGGCRDVLAGHDHIYERFAPQTPIGDPNPLTGSASSSSGRAGSATSASTQSVH